MQISKINAVKNYHISYKGNVQKNITNYASDCFEKIAKSDRTSSELGVVLGLGAAAFTSFLKEPNKVQEIEKELKEKNINCDFKDNLLVAQCTKQTVDIYEKIFGKWAIPSAVRFTPFEGKNKNYYAWYRPYYNDVEINSNKNCFSSMKKLKNAHRSDHYLGLNYHNTAHYLCTFIHEFAHCAHYNHLKQIGKTDAWKEYFNLKMPTLSGKILTLTKNSGYANHDMIEFMAERITKDVCKYLTDDGTFYGNPSSFDYEHLAEGKEFNYNSIARLNPIILSTVPHYQTEEEFKKSFEKLLSTPETIKNFSDIYARHIWMGDTLNCLSKQKSMQTY